MKADVSIQCFALPFDSPFNFAHETPAFVRKQPDYGAAGTSRTNNRLARVERQFEEMSIPSFRDKRIG